MLKNCLLRKSPSISGQSEPFVASIQKSYGYQYQGIFDRGTDQSRAFLLSLTDESVESIAYQVGFNSLVVFSRMFKKSTGETATNYRKRMKTKILRILLWIP